MFLDEVTIHTAGGAGGNGCVAWRREKYVPRGGPDGGDGGSGGEVIIVADENTDTLSDFLSVKSYQAEGGQPGTGKSMNGRGGEDLTLRVPPGTIITDVTVPVQEVLLADLQRHGDRVVVARGGRGGYGNAHFTSSIRRAPDFAERGETGQQCVIHMELKLVADVGVIGLPSVGKSSLIAAVSAARPKIAAYPFTTLVPNLGVVRVYDREFVLCDIPGLIEGASSGKGLGDKFLRHIERCGILIHLLDASHNDLAADYRTIRAELEKYSPALAQKEELVVLNKIDLLGGDTSAIEQVLQREGIPLAMSISAATRGGTPELMAMLLPRVLDVRRRRDVQSTLGNGTSIPEELPVLRPHLAFARMGAYHIEDRADGIHVVGKRLEQFTKMTDFSSPGGRRRFQDVIERIGLKRALQSARAKRGGAVEVYIGGVRVTEHFA